MEKFTVIIKETKSRSESVDMETAESALEEIIRQYNCCGIILTDDDLLPDVVMSVMDESGNEVISERIVSSLN